jgi:hypothetical protein
MHELVKDGGIRSKCTNSMHAWECATVTLWSEVLENEASDDASHGAYLEMPINQSFISGLFLVIWARNFKFT